jgi:hypothetical protein
MIVCVVGLLSCEMTVGAWRRLRSVISWCLLCRCCRCGSCLEDSIPVVDLPRSLQLGVFFVPAADLKDCTEVCTSCSSSLDFTALVSKCFSSLGETFVLWQYPRGNRDD